ncbi:MAG: alpha/beta hydrolase [Labilithrix sp.]|nr:alpha/beta hydrolase [Labilithrix sp.]MCW5817291.1 alpha/beta hydrolase [Labilithrix sp.]
MPRWLAVAFLFLVACRRPPAAENKPAAVAEPAPKVEIELEETKPAPPATVEKLLVPGDTVASIVRSADGKAPLSVFVGGVCSNAGAYLWSFREAAQKAGGVVALEGDQPCGPGASSDYHTFSWDASRLHARIEAALAASGVMEIPKEGITLVGYSQGAALGEQLAARHPGRYARVVVIASPRDPSPASFAKSRALVTMACDREVTARMRQAAAATKRLGTPATYLEMPGCIHGQVGDGERLFGEAFDWLAANEKPLDPTAKPTRIAGAPN